MASEVPEEHKFRIVMAEDNLLELVNSNRSDIRDLCNSIVSRRLKLGTSGYEEEVENYLHLVFVSFLSGNGRYLYDAVSKMSPKPSEARLWSILLKHGGDILAHLMLDEEFDPEYIAPNLIYISVYCKKYNPKDDDDLCLLSSARHFCETIIHLVDLVQNRESSVLRQACVDSMQDVVISSFGTDQEDMFAIGKAAVHMFIRCLVPDMQEDMLSKSLN